ncbi:hypothetical protein [Chamaesiphon sp. VAR_69_metabat_338]|uniref:hypothetical protein n=1 Tax=Chamaesiphon sp. VAR_69_metabat_338 TaxID=2964704 RepID=UPI00286DA896|nr:hypothetical protein [Chamaesiphon sp. VAR_69_metabat_338]
MKIIRQTATLLAIDQQPSTGSKREYAVLFAVGVGFFIWVLTLAHGLPWYAIVIGLLVPVWIFYLTLRAMTSIACTFDKKLNLLILKRKSWLSEKVFQHHLSEIQSVHSKVFHDPDGDDTYEIGIDLRSGSYLRLNEPSTSFDQSNTEAIVSAIESFLNLYHHSM